MKNKTLIISTCFIAGIVSATTSFASEGPLWAYITFSMIAFLYTIGPYILGCVVLYYVVRYRSKREQMLKTRLIVTSVILAALVSLQAYNYIASIAELKKRETYLAEHPEIAQLNMKAAEDLGRFSTQLKGMNSPAGQDAKVRLSSLPRGSAGKPVFGVDAPITALSEKIIRERYSASSLSMKSAAELHTMGIERYGNRQFLGAIAAWFAELDKRPNDGVVLTNIGLAFLRAGDIPRGIAYAKRASEADPTYGRALYVRAIGYLQSGDLPSALHVLNYAESLGLVNDDLYFARGNTYEALGRPYSAREEYKKMKKDPTKTDFLGRPVQRPELWGSGPDGFEVSEARALMSRHTMGSQATNTASMNTNMYAEAIMKKTYGKPEYESMSSSELHRIGLELFKQRNYAGAVAAWLVEADKDPRNANTLNNVAIAYTAFAVYDMGLKYGKKALEIDPRFGHAHEDLGRTYLLINKPEQALYHSRQAVSNNWNTADSNYNIGLALDALRRKKEAHAAYERVKIMAPNYPGLSERLRSSR